VTQWENRFREVDRRKIVDLAKKSLWGKEGKEVLNYLKNERGFSDVVIDELDFGFCPSNIDHQLRGRIITPIYDAYDCLVALSTRDFRRGKGFWHETFAKKMYVYGLNCAKESIIKSQKVIVVEGEFDVASLRTNGFKMTVGICGSALTLFHIVLLARYCSDIYLAFDGDTAGERALEGAMKIYKGYNLEANDIRLIPVGLPSEMDPNDCLRKQGAKKFKEILIASKEEYSLI
jgi:DNA primase